MSCKGDKEEGEEKDWLAAYGVPFLPFTTDTSSPDDDTPVDPYVTRGTHPPLYTPGFLLGSSFQNVMFPPVKQD